MIDLANDADLASTLACRRTSIVRLSKSTPAAASGTLRLEFV